MHLPNRMDDVQKNILDSEFRQILYIIKSQINNINNHFHLERYRVWLERLSSAHPKEKLERNAYLLALANQIHDNVLEPPFTYNPPKGLLPSLRKIQNTFQRFKQEPEKISDHFFGDNADKVEWSYLSPRKLLDKKENKSMPVQRKKSFFMTREAYLPRKRSFTKQKTQEPFKKIGKEEIKSGESSWYDLSDATDGSQACGDNSDVEIKNRKGLRIQHKEEALKTKEQFAKKEHEKSDFKGKHFSTGENRNRKPTQEEVEALKLRMKDLLEVKNALKDTHYLTQDRKKTIENLENKLAKLKQRNSELEKLLEEQKKKNNELEKNKSKELYELKEKFSKARQKEIESMRQFHKEETTNLEKNYNCKIRELEERIESIKKDNEEKIKKLIESNLSLLKEKDGEIQKLSNNLKQKTVEISNKEENEEQIFKLKRCLSRMDKIIHKNEKEYTKTIQKLTQELELKDMSNQVLQQTKKADFIIRNTSEKQAELRDALNSLEAKYKKLMENVQLQSMETKKQDEERITKLKELLQKNNIAF